MKVVIVGASGSLGRSLAYAEASNGHDLFLCATDRRDLEPLKSDIELRFKVKVEIQAIDFAETANISQLPLDYGRYHFPLGLSLDEDCLTLSEMVSLKLTNVNFLSIALFVSRLIEAKGDRFVDIIGYGSIAQTRGRSRNVFYSAAKRALTSYFESLLHAQDKQKIHAYLFQLGYMKSQQSLGKKLLFPSIAPEEVAKRVLTYIEDSRTGIAYLPGFWWYVCILLRFLPWSIYRKLSF